MLSTLSIHNVALIDQLDIEFFEGFSVLTGETGAGKSIIIEALNFVLGERASRELIMSGEAKASVEARFALSDGEAVQPVLSELELVPEDGELVLYRELSASGKGVCRVNGTPVSVAILKRLGDTLVDIHGQHEHQSLLNPKLHIDLLDAFAGGELPAMKQRVHQAYRVASEAGRKLRGAEMNERDRERRCDLLSYQIKEIDSANLTDGEEEALSEQRALLQNAQTIMQSLDESAEGMNGDEGVLVGLSAALHALERIAPFHKDYEELSGRLSEAYYTLEDVAYGIRDLRNSFSYEPGALDEIETRLELIATLKRKYGADVREILDYRDKSAEEYDQLLGSEQRREALLAAYDEAVRAYADAAAALSALRKQAAVELSRRLLPELGDLGMPHAAFEVAFARLEGDVPSPNGVDEVEFLLSANRGEPVKPLSKVASGGEISRIMLSFKSVLADADHMPTMVFDEIDTGISGQIGTAVAVKMRQIARGRQVLSITHLPQIAAHANRQYLVYKQTDGERTRSFARLLTERERVCEIARIMGGTPGDGVAMQHAASLIAAAGRNESLF